MLRSALKALGGTTMLHDADIAPDQRAETLSVSDFDRLAQLIATGDQQRL
jgi:16S rRNA (adenine1518-N6/adenine1519-N6)-dimethyltransferase